MSYIYSIEGKREREKWEKIEKKREREKWEQQERKDRQKEGKERGEREFWNHFNQCTSR